MSSFDLDALLNRNPHLSVVSVNGRKPNEPRPKRRSSAKRKSVCKSTDTERLLHDIGLMSLPQPVLEHRFHDTRRWRFDLAWPDLKIACEIEGGVWMQTKTGRGKGHAHPKRFISDIEKYNQAALLGWLLIRATPEMVKDGRAVLWLQQAVEVRESL